MAPGCSSNCAFTTARLRVGPWHTEARHLGIELGSAIAGLLTSATTAALPGPWQGDYSTERAEAWIRERDAESPMLLAWSTEERTVVGLVILHEMPLDQRGADLRIGYVIDEAHWGLGLASELLGGLVAWARAQPSLLTMTGGVEPSNIASIRVLEKCGFTLVDHAGSDDSLTYQLNVASSGSPSLGP